MNNRTWNGLRVRMWLVVLVFAVGIVVRRPKLGLAVALIVAAGMLATHLARRKQTKR